LFFIENIALGKPAEQSSDYDRSGHGPEKAVDGDTNQGSGEYTHQALNNEYVWWNVSLTQLYNIESIKIYIRTDWCMYHFL